jgi:hypothetical protein
MKLKGLKIKSRIFRNSKNKIWCSQTQLLETQKQVGEPLLITDLEEEALGTSVTFTNKVGLCKDQIKINK